MCGQGGAWGSVLLPWLVWPVEGRRRLGHIPGLSQDGGKGPPAPREAAGSTCRGLGVHFVDTGQGGVLGERTSLWP